VRALSRCVACAPVNSEVRSIIHNSTAPRILVLGQAPGKLEKVQRQGFVGPSGSRLWTWLGHTGYDEAWFRRHAYVTSVTKCFPGPHPSGRGDRVPSPAEQKTCSGWLNAELALIQPDVIVLIGRLAISTVLSDDPLDLLIGTRFTKTLQGQTSQIHPLPHPSGASSWFHIPAHQVLIQRGLGNLTQDLRQLNLP